jgi:gluconate 5-dehydrogenase
MSIASKFSLKNKIAVITGGYGHLGKSMTEALAQAGAQVVVLGRSRIKFKEAFGGKKDISFVVADIASSASIQKAFKAVKKVQGAIDVLVNNAMYMESNLPDKMTDAQWERGMDGVLNSVFRCTREVVPYMKGKGGSIINIASMYGVVSPDFRVYKNAPKSFNPPSYGTGKAGVIQLTKYCGVYYAPDHIRVNAISPGPFPSPAVQENKVFIQELCARNPMNRIGHPDDLKGTVVFLACEASCYITGQNILVDGGWTAW